MSFEKLAELATAADSITLHVQKITDTSFMVVIQPSLKLAEKYPQLASPLQVIAAPKDLDREVVAALTQYTPVLQQATSNISDIEKAVDEAAKAAKEKLKPKAKPATATTSASTPKPMEKTTEQTTGAPPNLDLFNVGESPEAEASAGSNSGDDGDLPPLDD